MNMFIMLGAAGLSHEFFGERLFPIGTVYDPFISRGLDALNYACYQNARFMLVATPSGITLAPEGGAHQSIGTPMIGISQPGILSFEPAYSDELNVIIKYGFEYMQDEQNGGSVYLRLSTKPLDQLPRKMSENLKDNIIKGAYWLREPGDSPTFIIIYQGVIVDEVIKAIQLLGEKQKDLGVLAITSSDILFHEWKNNKISSKHTTQGCHIENLLKNIPKDCKIITVLDGHPMTLSWIAGVFGHHLIPLGINEFGQTGTSNDLYKKFNIDSISIINSVNI